MIRIRSDNESDCEIGIVVSEGISFLLYTLVLKANFWVKKLHLCNMLETKRLFFKIEKILNFH